MPAQQQNVARIDRDHLSAVPPSLFCLVPANLRKRLHEPLRAWFASDSSIEVVVERRSEAPADTQAPERRRAMRSATMPELPPIARPYRARLRVVQLASCPGAVEARGVELAERVAEGASGAFDELYLRYYNLVYGRVRAKLADAHEADDLAQAILIKVLKALRQGNYRGQPFDAWLATVVQNHLTDHLRKHGRVEVWDPEQLIRWRDTSDERLPEPSLGWLNDPRIAPHFERLRPRERQVLTLTYLGGFGAAEIAHVLGSTEGCIRTTRSQALAKLEARISDAPVGKGRRAAFGLTRRSARRCVSGRSFSMLPPQSPRLAAWGSAARY